MQRPYLCLIVGHCMAYRPKVKLTQASERGVANGSLARARAWGTRRGWLIGLLHVAYWGSAPIRLTEPHRGAGEKLPSTGPAELPARFWQPRASASNRYAVELVLSLGHQLWPVRVSHVQPCEV